MYRPSGLTALSVFNFILGGWGVINLLLLAVYLSMGMPQAKGGGPPPPESLVYTKFVYLLIDSALLIVSGIGYLKLKRFLGRWVGTVDAIISLIFFCVIIGLTQSAGARFNISSLTMLVYPGLTLVLLNVVFRDNLVN